MNDQERKQWMDRSNVLKIELKTWERSFSGANNGQKLSRDDIKKNPPIAAKYKEYNKIRDLLSGKVSQLPPKPERQTPRKRKLEEKGHAVSKRQNITQTPSSGSRLRLWEVDISESPSVVRNLFTPSKQTLGPTPQKDGQVLGLFDLLQEDGSEGTPSKGNNIATKSNHAGIQATPRKAGAGQLETLKHSRTPASAGKRYILDAFATPLKNKAFNGQAGKTPSSVSKLHFSTPSFLRRDSQRTHLPVVGEGEESPQMVRIPRKPLVRGLSSMLAGLRKMEEEAADDDLEALREMEAHELAAGGDKPASKRKLAAPTQDIALVEESQPNFPLGGFDDEAAFDSEPEDATRALGRDGQPLKVYKKKGQKRATRRVNIKPTRSKPAAQGVAKPAEDSDEEVPVWMEAVSETQIGETGVPDGRNFDSDSQSEYTASEGGTRYKRPKQGKDKTLNKDGKIKTAARKVKAAAHQNFKRLKLRNSGAKGGSSHNSRFSRKK